MPIADQRRQFVKSVKPCKRRVEIVLDQRCVGSVEVFAGPKIAEQMNGRGAERIVAAFDPRAGLVNGDAELFVIGAMPFQFVPVAGGERNAVAVEDGRRGESCAQANSAAD